MRSDITPTASNPSSAPEGESAAEKGKVGLAILMWLLGVPRGIVLLHLNVAH
jgi:hypothetical protein